MNRFLDPKPKRRRLQYDRANLQRAFDATARGMSVYWASREFSVPESTLRDRTRGNVSLDTKVGVETLFTESEEKQLVDHVKYMASIGYGYNKSGVQYMARDYAVSLNKPVKSKDSLSNDWFYEFLKRWSDLKIVKPQKLAMSRAKCASKENLDNYFKELGTILTINDLKNHPERVYNVDETGVCTEHSPPKIVCARDSSAQSVTSPRTYNVTIIGGGNALGNHVPPYYVFPGKRWNDDFMEGAAAGSDGEMSTKGWSNSAVFNNYLTKHFAKYAGITDKQGDQKTLVLYDGHKSHAQLTLTDWAKKHNVILFVLPPHSSHLTQPLDVGVFGPFKCMYNHECEIYKKNNPGISITKYSIAKLTAKPYVKAFSPENLSSAFKKAGIFPFNSSVITPEQVAPSIIYTETVEQVQPVESDVESDSTINYSTVTNNVQEASQQQSESCTPVVEISDNFFSARNITVVKQRPKRKFVPPFVAGSLHKKTNQDILSDISIKAASKAVPEKKIPKTVQKTKLCTKKSTTVVNKCPTSAKKCSKISSGKAKKTIQPVPSTSGLNKRKGAPIDLISEDSCDGDSDIFNDDDELCCVCERWEPKELQQCNAFVIAKWAKCDYCPHWTHLIYCSEVRFVRFREEFRCPHCLTKP